VILLACDLDNTLLHSPERPGDICVEHKNGKAYTFMSSNVYQGLEELAPDIRLVPVTGKSADQYRRIHYFTTRVPAYALTSCGGVLFRDGKQDPLWQAAFHSQVQKASAEMRLCFDQIRTRRDVSYVKWVDNTFITAQSPDSQGIVSRLSRQADTSVVDVFRVDERLYIFPRGVNKGSALNLLRREVQPELLICAGDNGLDIQMLNIADIALVPDENLARQVKESPEFRGQLYCAGQDRANNPIDFAEYIVTFAVKRGTA
jgi:hydroxymethylpyrimidine pyrophosphatase-like HAD family hydrolase